MIVKPSRPGQREWSLSGRCSLPQRDCIHSHSLGTPHLDRDGETYLLGAPAADDDEVRS